MINLNQEPSDMCLSANIYCKQKAAEIDIKRERPYYHLTGVSGWINDPNGFSYYNGKIHLFYQSNPYRNEWGVTYWGHAISDDFVRWEYNGMALAPDTGYDSLGVFSGSAIAFKDKYYLVYTGNSKGMQVQCIAESSDGMSFVKSGFNPVIDASMLPADTSEADFRDPKVWEKDGKVYMIVSARNRTDGWSKLLLYSTCDMNKWYYNGILLSNNSRYGKTLGHMFECPDLFTLGGKEVIIVSPQSVTGHYNGDSNVYIVGSLNYSTSRFEDFDLGNAKEIDRGFDFYAPQTMEMPDGRRIMTAWMATWNRTPVSAHLGLGFAGAMTFPRELSLINGHLYQKPVKEISIYYTDGFSKEINVTDENIYISELDGKAQDITLSFEPVQGKTGISVFDDGMGNGLKVYYLDGRVYLDRTGVTVGYYTRNEEYKITYADAPVGDDGRITIRLLLDKYSCEVFVCNGYSAITSAVIPSEEQEKACLFSDSHVLISIIKSNITVE